jgi:hypothetical protein
MKKFVVSMLLILAFVVVNAGIASAAPEDGKKAPSAAQLAQQEKMKACNKEAKEKGLKGDARKEFMKSCLSGKVTGVDTKSAKLTQQEKMKACNEQAATKALKGDERKAFMSDCLKN